MDSEDFTIVSHISESNLTVLASIAAQTPFGCFIEIGVYKGGSAFVLSEIAKMQGRQLHLFDTFCGIPEKSDIDTHNVGDFSDTTLEEVREKVPEAFYHVGIFPGTLPVNLGRIAFAHVDCDNYESVRAACLLLPSRMVTGGVIYFDDYGRLEGATAAVNECFPYRIELANGKAMVIVT
jgi:hypothetical protein